MITSVHTQTYSLTHCNGQLERKEREREREGGGRGRKRYNRTKIRREREEGSGGWVEGVWLLKPEESEIMITLLMMYSVYLMKE